jgi:pimeloyl-ACP methyl ester carboxylesterase
MNKTIIYNHRKIHFTDQGQGDAVVLLHGFLGSLHIWDDFSRELSSQFRVVVIDLPGHGSSEVIEEASMETLAASVKAVLDSLQISSCLVVGHSMGGYVALEFARQNLQALRGLCLFHSHASADTEEAKENRRRTINIVRLNHDGFVRQFIPNLFAESNIERLSNEINQLQKFAAEVSVDGIVAALEAMGGRSGAIELLQNIEVPVLFIAGKDDSRIAVHKIMSQAMLPQHAEVLILSNVGHMGFVEAPEKTLPVLRDFAIRTFTTKALEQA